MDEAGSRALLISFCETYQDKQLALILTEYQNNVPHGFAVANALTVLSRSITSNGAINAGIVSDRGAPLLFGIEHSEMKNIFFYKCLGGVLICLTRNSAQGLPIEHDGRKITLDPVTIAKLIAYYPSVTVMAGMSQKEHFTNLPELFQIIIDSDTAPQALKNLFTCFKYLYGIMSVSTILKWKVRDQVAETAAKLRWYADSAGEIMTLTETLTYYLHLSYVCVVNCINFTVMLCEEIVAKVNLKNIPESAKKIENFQEFPVLEVPVSSLAWATPLSNPACIKHILCVEAKMTTNDAGIFKMIRFGEEIIQIRQINDPEYILPEYCKRIIIVATRKIYYVITQLHETIIPAQVIKNADEAIRFIKVNSITEYRWQSFNFKVFSLIGLTAEFVEIKLKQVFAKKVNSFSTETETNVFLTFHQF